MLDYAVAQGLPVDEAERKYPFLLPQRLSAAVARDVFGVGDRSFYPTSTATRRLKAIRPYMTCCFFSG
jgi:hypothetical protein